MKTKWQFIRHQWLAAILFCCFAITLSAQKTAAPKASTDKIELVWRTHTSTTINSNGTSSSRTSEIPNIRINGEEKGTAMRFDLNPWLKACPSAKKEWGIWRKTKNKPLGTFFGHAAMGGGIALATFFTAISMDSKGKKGIGAVAGGGAVLAIGIPIYGAIKAQKQKKVAVGHLENAIRIYNTKCYSPPKADSLPPSSTKPVRAKKKDKDDDLPEIEETSDEGIIGKKDPELPYRLIRNDPEHAQWHAVSVSPFEVKQPLGRGFSSLFFGLGVERYAGSKLGLRASASIAVLDNFQFNDLSDIKTRPSKWQPGDDPTLAPAKYKRAANLEINATYELKGRTRQRDDSENLGKGKKDGREVNVIGKLKSDMRESFNARGGLFYLQNTLQSDEGELPVFTATTADPLQLGYAQVGQRQAGLALGASVRRVRDLKIEVLDPHFKGVKGGFNMSEYYADVLLAPFVKLADVVEFGAENPSGGDFPVHSLNATPLQKIGGRIGYRQTRFNEKRGQSAFIEYAIQPGPKKMGGHFRVGWNLLFGGRQSN